MKSLRIEFLDDSPNGLRRVTEYNWQGECLICSRGRLDHVTDWKLFDVPGVYMLIGPPGTQEQTGSPCSKPTVYIGQGDSVLDRLQSHLRSKDFWTTAVAFKRKDSLNAGNIKYLESRLCALAIKTGTCHVTNISAPTIPALPASEKAETEDFLEKVLFFLPALGWDFFESLALPAATGSHGPGEHEPPEVPANVRTVFEDLKRVLSGLPDAEFYFTMSPDYRAKLTSGSEFRVFARLKLAKKWIRLELKDVGRFKVVGSENLSDETLNAINKAHEEAGKYLSRTK